MSRVAITGGLSYTGRYLAKLLLDEGHSVVSLSRRRVPIAPAPLTDADLRKVAVKPLDFSDDKELRASLTAATLWCAPTSSVARQVGVKRVVFTSHTHASEDSPYPYLANKAKACRMLRETGLPSYAIARPCGVFGDTAGESILMNNAAWVLRRVPLVLLPGDGSARFQPIHVRDFAELLRDLAGLGPNGAGSDAQERDACGPDAPTSRELFSHIATSVGSPAFVGAGGSLLSTKLVTTLSKPIDWYTGDVLLDQDDLDFLNNGLTVADDPTDPAIKKRRSLMDWISSVGPSLGNEYVSSVAGTTKFE
eukprot:CAMPEP_0206625602 /NCGR_PEP_ID=MMETSP0325_2-20121206/64836_1 /ASSEMBLY_ACC=CAM_ASM_000347 /TAXON_ID=2866 /ORGANISM="Crypthecodinium cohnii, Strain Seligo" /LENGTH=307 /DNA_ID=CAMNT_0054149823 /DNA_START=334 /DNA_END=1256 /DNA_ORIENTATION=-